MLIPVVWMSRSATPAARMAAITFVICAAFARIAAFASAAWVTTPADAVLIPTRLLRQDRLDGFVRVAVPPDLHRQLQAAWQQGRTCWPLEELPFGQRIPGLLQTLSAAGAEQRLAANGSNGEDGERIQWLEFDRAEAEARSAAGELVFVDVTADWCFTCKANERLVLETPETRALFAEHDVVPMKADWTNRDDRIAAFLADYGKYSIPFYLLYRPGQEPLPFSELLTKNNLAQAVREADAHGS